MEIRKSYKCTEKQLEFQEGKGCETAILRHGENAKKLSYAALLNLRGACDSVPRKKLIGLNLENYQTLYPTYLQDHNSLWTYDGKNEVWWHWYRVKNCPGSGAGIAVKSESIYNIHDYPNANSKRQAQDKTRKRVPNVTVYKEHVMEAVLNNVWSWAKHKAVRWIAKEVHCNLLPTREPNRTARFSRGANWCKTNFEVLGSEHNMERCRPKWKYQKIS